MTCLVAGDNYLQNMPIILLRADIMCIIGAREKGRERHP